MRQQGQQNRRGRGRGGRKIQNPLSRNYDSNGPDVKIRGTAAHIAEKYSSLARDALSSGDTISAENLFQHAEHYNRIIMSAQQQGQTDTQPVIADQSNGSANEMEAGSEHADRQSSEETDSERKSDRPNRPRNAKGNGSSNNRRRRRRPNGSGNGASMKNGTESGNTENNAASPATTATKKENSGTDEVSSPNGALL